MDECSTCSCLGINYLNLFVKIPDAISCANSPEVDKSRYHLTDIFQSQIAFMLVVLSKKLCTGFPSR